MVQKFAELRLGVGNLRPGSNQLKFFGPWPLQNFDVKSRTVEVLVNFNIYFFRIAIQQKSIYLRGYTDVAVQHTLHFFKLVYKFLVQIIMCVKKTSSDMKRPTVNVI